MPCANMLRLPVPSRITCLHIQCIELMTCLGTHVLILWSILSTLSSLKDLNNIIVVSCHGFKKQLTDEIDDLCVKKYEPLVIRSKMQITDIIARMRAHLEQVKSSEQLQARRLRMPGSYTLLSRSMLRSYLGTSKKEFESVLNNERALAATWQCTCSHVQTYEPCTGWSVRTWSSIAWRLQTTVDCVGCDEN